MENIKISKAEKSELEWINLKYSEVDFVQSDYDNELIVVAKIKNEKCGLGRLVIVDNENLELGGIYVFKNYRKKGVAECIVKYLCEKNTFKQKQIWCLPFDNLKTFYENFGFVENQKQNDKTIPQEIIKKHIWCNNKYERAVLLLSKNN